MSENKPASIDDVTTEHILEAIGDVSLDATELLKTGAYYAITDIPVPGHVFGKVLAHLTHRIMNMEEAIQKGTHVNPGPPPRMPRAPKHSVALPEGVTAPVCPKCGGGSVLRRASATGQLFFGCKGFPTCRGTTPFEEKKT